MYLISKYINVIKNNQAIALTDNFEVIALFLSKLFTFISLVNIMISSICNNRHKIQKVILRRNKISQIMKYKREDWKI